MKGAATGPGEEQQATTMELGGLTLGALQNDAAPAYYRGLVGDFLLKIGDSIPNYPEVRIATIEKQLVTYEIADEKFNVDVRGYDNE